MKQSSAPKLSRQLYIALLFGLRFGIKPPKYLVRFGAVEDKNSVTSKSRKGM